MHTYALLISCVQGAQAFECDGLDSALAEAVAAAALVDQALQMPSGAAAADLTRGLFLPWQNGVKCCI